MPPPLLPIKRPALTNCSRCGHQYPQEELKCPHCSELSDSEVEVLKQRKLEQDQAHFQLGKTFLMIAGIAAVLLVLMMLS